MNSEMIISFDELYDNCLYSYFAHAAWSAIHPVLTYTRWWDGMNYTFIHGASSRGTITFDFSNKIFVGACRDDKSSRIGWYPKYKATDLFNKAPEAAKILAGNEAVQYLFDEVEGIEAPVATTAFWSEENRFVCFDNPDDFTNHGGEFVSLLTVSLQELKTYFETEEYELTSAQFELVEFLFKSKKSGNLIIKKRDIPLVSKRDTGYKEFFELLTQVGFEVK